jgi:protein-S-isoprenylcysteine O-methyltransferase Ste14
MYRRTSMRRQARHDEVAGARIWVMSRSLPTLGRRGEGWVVLQIVLIGAVFLSAFAGRSWSGTFRVVAYALGGTVLVLGLWMLVAGAARLGKALTPLPAPRQETDVVSTGVYRLVRHPIYGGGLLIALGWTIVFATWPGAVLTAVLAVFFDLKSRREEVWLVERLRGYDAYRRATPRRLLPFIY